MAQVQTQLIHSILFGEIPNAGSSGCDHDKTSNRALPALGRTDARKQLVLAQQGTEAIGTSVVHPKEHKHAERNEIGIDLARSSGTKCQHIDE